MTTGTDHDQARTRRNADDGPRCRRCGDRLDRAPLDGGCDCGPTDREPTR